MKTKAFKPVAAGAWPTLRTVFVAVNLAILAVPLGGIFFLRLYESVLIRRAEAELIAQGAVLAATYRQELARELLADGVDPAGYGRPVPSWLLPREDPARGRFEPRIAMLDLTIDPLLGETPEPVQPAAPPELAAVRAGERLGGLLAEVQKVTLAGIRLTDRHGTVVGSTGQDLGRSLRNRGEVLGALHGEPVSCLRERVSDGPRPALDSLSRTGQMRVYVTVPVLEADRVWGAVVLGRTPMGVVQSLYGIRGYVFAAAGLLLVLVTLVSLLISFAVSRPIRRLVARTERVARGERRVAVQLARPGTHEIELLSNAIERMTRRLEQRADYIRGFASGVSHEFKTPLASMRGAIELLGDHLDTMSAEERGRFLGNLAEDVTRLDRLVRGLLDLARADVIEPGESSCEVAAVLAGAGLDPGGLEVAPGVGRARLSAEALQAIVSNLVDNARRHGGAGVRLRVAARRVPRQGQAGVEVVVSDDGRGVPPADQARIFEPFFTTARDQGGTGLGLAVVRSLVEAHGGTIALDSRPGATEFRVWLPG